MNRENRTRYAEDAWEKPNSDSLSPALAALSPALAGESDQAGKDMASVRTDRQRNQMCENLRAEIEHKGDVCTALWNAFLAFESYPFKTTSNLPFTYTFKPNRYGERGNEILVSRKSKTLTRSSVEKAFDKVMELGADGALPVKLSTPKELGVFGASYIYPVFICLGLVEHVGDHRRGGPKKGSRRKKKAEDLTE